MQNDINTPENGANPQKQSDSQEALALYTQLPRTQQLAILNLMRSYLAKNAKEVRNEG
jgi:hypothetical protein